MSFRIETVNQPDYPDVHGQEIKHEIEMLGIRSIDAIQSIRVTLLEGDLREDDLNRIGKELLADPVSEDYLTGLSAPPPGLAQATLFEVHLKPGVMDPVANSTKLAICDLGIKVSSVRTVRKYIILGSLNEKQKKLIAEKVLGNDCIEDVLVGNENDPPSPHLKSYDLNIHIEPISSLNDEELMDLSLRMDMFLNLAEMKTIQDHYRRLQREPTDIELETLAQTWSEHCVHKTLKSTVELTDYSETPEGKTVVIENILKSTIARATYELDKPWCISVFEDNAGIIEFDEEYGVCFKVETHNHPSAIEPYGGAATGIGGVIRDTMGTGLGARPLANTDIFCFAPPDMPQEKLPAGVLRPRRVMKGVVSGVRDYGNRMGIPTVNGAIYFDQRYIGNPLVFCGNVGLIPRDMCFGSARPGDLIMVVGGRTGRDGIHGATFSSGEMTHEHETLFSHAVQIGNAITEKKVLDTLLEARDEGLFAAITDCGAGGLSSAVGEMGAEVGAEVDLEKVPLKYDGLSYTEIWISEAQERMVIAVPPEHRDRLEQIFYSENVEATVIGTFGNDDTSLVLRYDGRQVGELDMAFLHDGLPVYTRKATWHKPDFNDPAIPEKENYTEDLKNLLGDFNLASKEWVIRQYDHEVQAASAIKPLVGVANDGPGDASVIRPRLDSDRGVALGCGLCPQYGDIDPYWMALAAIDEAMRNIVAVGANPERVAILDNFCWGNCDKPDRLGGLVKASQGCYDGAMAFGTPFISGKDSLNNEFKTESGETISIPPTLLISAMALVDDVKQCATMDAKQEGNMILVVGETRNELGASHYYKLHGEIGTSVPKVDLGTAPQIMAAIAKAIRQGLVRACHDCSEGGLAVALAEMAFAGGVGMEIDASAVPVSKDVSRIDQILFSESPSRFILEIEPDNFGAVAKIVKDFRFAEIGKVTEAAEFLIKDEHNKAVIESLCLDLKEAWQAPLRW
jgi:phosphoribosylformylglycinamidine synthase